MLVSSFPHQSALSLSVLLVLANGLNAQTVLERFESGNFLSDFRFDDISGTTIDAAANSANATILFDDDSDIGGAVTNGSGQFDLTGKSTTSFASHYLDLATVSTGSVISLVEFSWNYDESVYDSGQDEEIRWELMDADPRTTISTVRTTLIRDSATTTQLFADGVGSGASDSSDIAFGSSGSLLALLEANLDNDSHELFYSTDGGTSFLSAGQGSLNSTRDLESMRLVFNEDFSDDTVLVERVAVVHIPVPEPSSIVLALFGGLLGISRRRRSPR